MGPNSRNEGRRGPRTPSALKGTPDRDEPTPTAVPPTVTIGGDLTVGNIGYGAMQLTGPKVWGDYPDHDKGVALLREVVAEGVTFIDTADVYGPHSNEELIREALHPYPANLVIASRAATCAAAPSTATWARSATSGTCVRPLT